MNAQSALEDTIALKVRRVLELALLVFLLLKVRVSAKHVRKDIFVRSIPLSRLCVPQDISAQVAQKFVRNVMQATIVFLGLQANRSVLRVTTAVRAQVRALCAQLVTIALQAHPNPWLACKVITVYRVRVFALNAHLVMNVYLLHNHLFSVKQAITVQQVKLIVRYVRPGLIVLLVLLLPYSCLVAISVLPAPADSQHVLLAIIALKAQQNQLSAWAVHIVSAVKVNVKLAKLVITASWAQHTKLNVL